VVITVGWEGETVKMLDQRLLPGRIKYLYLKTAAQVAQAIRKMVTRGAPAIGIAAAMGLALGAAGIRARNRAAWERRFETLCRTMIQARPTAVNLAWAVGRMKALVAARPEASPDELAGLLRAESQRVLDEDVAACRAMGRVGAAFLPERATVMTHCNAGSLATGGYGTALGVIRAAVEAGKAIEVIANETRPYLQGARLTAWELNQDNIPVRIITDNMAGALMARGLVDAVVVGADRIAINGDVANKVGTYSLSVLARTHRIPFYVAAPVSTIDPDCPSGAQIPIERRPSSEVTRLAGRLIAPAGIEAIYEAFDVTPARNIRAIFTERGAVTPPGKAGLKRLLAQAP